MLKKAAVLSGLMCLSYCVIAVNMRAVAYEKYGWIAATDAAICVLNFTIIRRVADATTKTEQAGYTVGGITGALAGVWLSRLWG